jgi:hypothetical protein
LKCFLE